MPAPSGRVQPAAYLALGDSYTIGEGVAPEARWPAQLAGRLTHRGFPVDLAAVRAQTGWTAADLIASLDDEPIAGAFDLVSLLIGVNDQYDGRSLAAFRTDFAALLNRAIVLAGDRPERVFTVSIPDWSVTPHAADIDHAAVRAALVAFNDAAARLAEAHGVAWFDVAPLSRAAADDPTLLVDDGLHPSGRMYAAWADALAPPVAALLRASP